MDQTPDADRGLKFNSVSLRSNNLSPVATKDLRFILMRARISAFAAGCAVLAFLIALIVYDNVNNVPSPIPPLGEITKAEVNWRTKTKVYDRDQLKKLLEVIAVGDRQIKNKKFRGGLRIEFTTNRGIVVSVGIRTTGEDRLRYLVYEGNYFRLRANPDKVHRFFNTLVGYPLKP